MTTNLWESLYRSSFLLWQILNSGLTTWEVILPVNMRSEFTMRFLNFMSKFTKQTNFFLEVIMKQTPGKFHTDKNLKLNLYNFQKFSFLTNSYKLYVRKLCLHICFSNSDMLAFTIKQSKQCNFHPPGVWLLYLVAFIIPVSQLQ